MCCLAILSVGMSDFCEFSDFGDARPRDVVEVVRATSQQLSVIRHCMIFLWAAKNKGNPKKNHTMSDDLQLLRSSSCNFNNIPCTKPVQKFEVTDLHTRARHLIVEPL